MGDTNGEAEQGRDKGMPQGPEGEGNESVGTSTQWKHKIKISMKVSDINTSYGATDRRARRVYRINPSCVFKIVSVKCSVVADALFNMLWV